VAHGVEEKEEEDGRGGGGSCCWFVTICVVERFRLHVLLVVTLIVTRSFIHRAFLKLTLINRYSHDGGKTWSEPTPIHGVGCVRPRLHRLAAGPVLLTGGRLCPTLVPNATYAGHGCLPQSVMGEQGGMFLWANLDGMADAPSGTSRGGSEWRTYCLGAIHNQLWAGDPK
jgi:hypothetical protein